MASPRNDGTPCVRCGKPAEGVAYINDDRLCHGDHPPGEPSCYMLASWELTAGTYRITLEP